MSMVSNQISSDANVAFSGPLEWDGLPELFGIDLSLEGMPGNSGITGTVNPSASVSFTCTAENSSDDQAKVEKKVDQQTFGNFTDMFGSLVTANSPERLKDQQITTNAERLKQVDQLLKKQFSMACSIEETIQVAQKLIESSDADMQPAIRIFNVAKYKFGKTLDYLKTHLKHGEYEKATGTLFQGRGEKDTSRRKARDYCNIQNLAEYLDYPYESVLKVDKKAKKLFKSPEIVEKVSYHPSDTVETDSLDYIGQFIREQDLSSFRELDTTKKGLEVASRAIELKMICQANGFPITFKESKAAVNVDEECEPSEISDIILCMCRLGCDQHKVVEVYCRLASVNKKDEVDTNEQHKSCSPSHIEQLPEKVNDELQKALINGKQKELRKVLNELQAIIFKYGAAISNLNKVAKQ